MTFLDYYFPEVHARLKPYVELKDQLDLYRYYREFSLREFGYIDLSSMGIDCQNFCVINSDKIRFECRKSAAKHMRQARKLYAALAQPEDIHLKYLLTR